MNVTHEAVESNRQPETTIAEFDLCLSGGGFRATLFHLGVVLYLRAKNRLGALKEIYSVSGGSILAAHLVEFWNDYCPPKPAPVDGKPFAGTMRRLLKPITWFGFRTPVIYLAALAWLFPLIAVLIGLSTELGRFGLSLTVVGAIGLAILFLYPPMQWISPRMYRWMFKLKTDWLSVEKCAPTLHVLATDLLTGRLAEFSQAGFRLHPDLVSKIAGIREQNRSLSFAVAASAGFPPAFPPQIVSKDTERRVLTDGGVYDNLGISSRLKPDRICLVSDASGKFVAKGSKLQYDRMVLRNVRASDIVMSRLAEGDLKILPGQRTQIRIDKTDLTTPEIAESVRVELPRMRTDLNRFSNRETVALVLHGLDVAEASLVEEFGALSKAERESVYSDLRAALNCREGASLKIVAKDLQGSDRQPLWSLLLIVVVYAVILLGASYYLGGVRVERVIGLAYNFVMRSPSLHLVGTGDVRVGRALDENPTLALYWEKWIHVRSGRYYESSEFAGPLSATTLKVRFPSGALSQGEDAFAILVPQSKSLPEKLWLRTRVTGPQELTISIPAFAGRATIWLFAASDQELNDTTEWTPQEYTP